MFNDKAAVISLVKRGDPLDCLFGGAPSSFLSSNSVSRARAASSKGAVMVRPSALEGLSRYYRAGSEISWPEPRLPILG